jgi:hypothetical protein
MSSSLYELQQWYQNLAENAFFPHKAGLQQQAYQEDLMASSLEKSDLFMPQYSTYPESRQLANLEEDVDLPSPPQMQPSVSLEDFHDSVRSGNLLGASQEAVVASNEQDKVNTALGLMVLRFGEDEGVDDMNAAIQLHQNKLLNMETPTGRDFKVSGAWAEIQYALETPSPYVQQDRSGFVYDRKYS